MHNAFLYFQKTQSHHAYPTPEIQPIDHDVTQLMLTPLNKLLKLQDIPDFLEDFSLDSFQQTSEQKARNSGKRRELKRERREGLMSQMFYLDCDLQKILEDDEQLSNQSAEPDQDSQGSEEQSQLSNQEEEDYKTTNTVWGSKLKSQDTTVRDTQEQKHTTIDLSIVDYSQNIQRFSKNPKSELAKGIKEIESQNLVNEFERTVLLKKYLEKYLLEFESFSYEQSWKELGGDFKTISKMVLLGIEQTFSKKIGSINFEQRRVKLLKYLQKKKRRIWRKKVSYDCRKKVADGRLRIKGKFVTREQACEQLGLESLDNYSADEIKQMLQRRIDNSLNQSLC